MARPREAARPIQHVRTEIAVHFSRSRLAVADPQESQTNRSDLPGNQPSNTTELSEAFALRTRAGGASPSS
jgi:hypothetical protein